MNRNAVRNGALAAACAVALTACGGGGGGDGGGGGNTNGAGAVVEGSDVPVGVEQSVGSVVAFAKRLIGMTSENGEPVLLGNAKLATSETDSPEDL
ncbi:MAG: hypothetical protein JWQ88_3103 [Rhodoferax sp.]|nr:hypothetical protein [Rhodoferax sp.]